jgi:putative membrane protein
MTDKPAKPGDKFEMASALRDGISGLESKVEAAITTSTAGFARAAAIGDLYEIDASQIALQRSLRDDVKQFARHMIEDRTTAAHELQATLAALATPLTPPTQLDARHRSLIEDLEGADEDDFDHRFIAQQHSAQGGAITLFKTYRERGHDQALRMLCAKALPAMERHMQAIEQMRKAV